MIDGDVVIIGHYEEVIYNLSNSSNCNDLSSNTPLFGLIVLKLIHMAHWFTNICGWVTSTARMACSYGHGCDSFWRWNNGTSVDDCFNLHYVRRTWRRWELIRCAFNVISSNCLICRHRQNTIIINCISCTMNASIRVVFWTSKYQFKITLTRDPHCLRTKYVAIRSMAMSFSFK